MAYRFTNPPATTNHYPTWTWNSVGTGTFRFALNDANLPANGQITTEQQWTSDSHQPNGDHVLYLQEQLADGSWTPMITGRVSIIDELGSISFEGTQTILETTELGSYCNTRAHSSDVYSWSLNNDADGRFLEIDGTGRIYLSGIIDYEVNSSHEITVAATSRAGEITQTTVVISIRDVNEPLAPLADVNGETNYVLENSAVGTPVGR